MAPLTYAWLDGTLVSSTALHRTLVECALGPHEETLARTVRHLRVTHRRASARLGPASGSAAVWTHVAEPITRTLGWTVDAPAALSLGGWPAHVACVRTGSARRRALVAAVPWGVVFGTAMRPLCRMGLDDDTPHVMITNGRRWVCRDARRPLGRQHAALDLDAAHMDERVWEALWLLANAGRDRLSGMAQLTLALDASATTAVRTAVAEVREHLTRLLHAADAEVLTHIFRWLFLLFAEARGLVPVDNAIYRHGYAVSTIARHARRQPPPYGLWESLLASAGLAHHGSHHPLLRMTALNGTLFDPGATPRGRQRRLPDAAVAPMLTALTTVRTGVRERPIAFGDLGVEHLGTIYEDVLATGTSRGDERKRTGTFYTPRDLADHLVAETLGPLVENRRADEILALRILDPAAGSGAILASAARFLHAALEAAWVREGHGGVLDVPSAQRRDAIRHIVEQCLYGVDAHGRAVQVARLSLWLASMTRERPLTFLDHHLRQGNSLVGAWPVDVVTRSPAVQSTRTTSDGQARLFALEAWDAEAADLALAFTRMTAGPSDTADAVRDKTRTFRALRDDPRLVAWRRRADAWCAALMRAPMLARGVWTDIDAHLQKEVGALPPAVANVATQLQQAANDVGCFHWALEFPEIFHGAGASGFDAVLANPPWEMLRADTGDRHDRDELRRRRSAELRFVTRSGLYSIGGSAHRNLHQLFVERMLQLCRPGGRLGLIAPWGLAGDHGSGGTRERLLSSAALDRVTVFENRRAIFPIHRSVRFVALTATAGRPTSGVALSLPVDTLDALPEHTRGAMAVWLDADLLRESGGASRAFPCVRSAADLDVLRRIIAGGTRLGDAPWSLTFGRELNATDDRQVLDRTGEHPDVLPVIGGRHLRPFGLDVDLDGDPSLPRIRRSDAEARLPRGDWRRWRLAYRDVASAGNRWTLIAALVPADVVTTHTVFTVRPVPALRVQMYLCAVLNSIVANWFVRLYIGTHVTSALMARLPVPLPWCVPLATQAQAPAPVRVPVPASVSVVSPAAGHADYRTCRSIIRAAARLRRVPPASLETSDAYVALQADVARLYGLSVAQMSAILTTTPHLADATRAAILERLQAPDAVPAPVIRR